MMLGTVTALDQSNGLQIKLDGEEEGTKKKYSYLASYVPTVGDRVLVEEISGSYIVLGKLTTDYSQSGISRACTGNASTATSANSATNATNATTAKSATNATNATNATTANYVKNENSQGRRIRFYETSSVFYIAWDGGSWHKITTS